MADHSILRSRLIQRLWMPIHDDLVDRTNDKAAAEVKFYRRPNPSTPRASVGINDTAKSPVNARVPEPADPSGRSPLC